MLNTLDLQRLNSATKYPSIPTYHALGDKGRLTSEVLVDFTGETVFLSEKVDGTNTRIIVASDGTFIVGSRNDLLWYSEDLLFNPAQSIVDVMRSRVFEWLPNLVPDEGTVRVFFGESYGGKITGQSKQYTKEGATDFRLFDVVEFSEKLLAQVLSKDTEAISSWREAGNQPFVRVDGLEAFDLPLTPRLEFKGTVPTDHQEVLDWMTEVLPETQCRLDESGMGEPEGIIVRTLPRNQYGEVCSRGRGLIAKIRYPDYRRTLSQRQKHR